MVGQKAKNWFLFWNVFLSRYPKTFTFDFSMGIIIKTFILLILFFVNLWLLCRYLFLCAFIFCLWARVQVHLWILYLATIYLVVTVTTSQTVLKRFIEFIIILLKFYWLKMKANQWIFLGFLYSVNKYLWIRLLM